MQGFTFTAPIITEEQALEEREALSPEERDKVNRDVYGANSEIIETEETRTNALALFKEALEAIPDDEKSDFLEVRKHAPDLIEREFPPLAFLRCEGFDAWAAAKRYVGCWTTRKSIFGPERAFLPMTIDGAMAEDRCHLEQATFLILSNDKHGRSVIFLDRIQQFTAGIPRDTMPRVIFYISCVLSEMELVDKDGVVGLINYQAYDLYKHYDRKLTKSVVKIIHTLPFRVKALHMFTGPGKSVMKIVYPILIQIFGKEIRLRCCLHSGNGSEVWSKVEEYGLQREHIQIIYEYGVLKRIELAQAWITQRAALENKKLGGIALEEEEDAD